jgi:hypothetical protein
VATIFGLVRFPRFTHSILPERPSRRGRSYLRDPTQHPDPE